MICDKCKEKIAEEMKRPIEERIKCHTIGYKYDPYKCTCGRPLFILGSYLEAKE